MEPSPLTQQARPDVFQHKIVQLYEQLFLVNRLKPHDHDEDDYGEHGEIEHSEGFWREFFLLRPDRRSLRAILDAQTPDQLLGHGQSRQLFARSIFYLRSDTASKGDADIHALDTLATFLSSVLAKKYTNPSLDIINILVGLEDVDAVFTDFVTALDTVVKRGRTLDLRRRAVHVALAFTSGAWSTTLLSYLIQRDLFMGIVAFILASGTQTGAVEAFILLGVLANYNKFEFRNPYQMRLGDFVNEQALQTMVATIGGACQQLRSGYIEVQEDVPEGWTIGSTLSMIGLGSLAPGASRPSTSLDDDAAKRLFGILPSSRAAMLLSTFEFACLNKLFCSTFVLAEASQQAAESPLESYISLTSYMLQHAHLSLRTTYYAHLNLMVFRLLIEDAALCKAMCSGARPPFRMCRQRQPHLPQTKSDRPLICALLDLMVDGVNHNLRRRLDVGLYTLFVGILLRIVGYLSRSRTRFGYHWAELWRSLLNLVRFMTTYANDLDGVSQVDTLLDHVVNLVALSLSTGESFLPGPSAYDDLFYKIVETHGVLLKFRDAYSLGRRPTNSIDTLIGVGEHYQQILKGNSGRKKLGKLDTLQMADVIRGGYETLSIQTKEGLDKWERFREADERTLLKKVAREVVHDIKSLELE